MSIWRRPTTLLLALLAAITPTVPAMAATKPVSEIVVDAGTGRVFYAAQADRRRPPASLAKMMTLLLAFEALDAGKLRLDRSIPVSRRAARQAPSKLGVAPGRSITVRAAIRAVAIISANDIAVALAEKLAGSESSFVARMNRRAAQLGMTATRFNNASGLAPAGGTTSARDMATLARYIIRRHPDRYRLFSRRSLRWKGVTRPNHNRLLGHVRGVDGVKTGYTVPAGFNLAASAMRGGKRVIVVVLGARTGAARDLLVANLLESGFSSPRARPQRRSRR
ncbi:D-alanyl-D-alanine carboxypeptidase [Sphingomonas jinjuensis]|uniref:D-alanyl-D-alanine carboxypeptidase n=1 Tax=Sphingomonas jinjuensis TaxID=535907 RepID=A0A840FGR3_9SPHN|nr:D-alanyl-D-alanine carboxypeptidase family protein [Sphingomonas jinjuensis]MBB4153178.1 D-alanyl-D-alanine carboxypeptidase [Sphingomonas jinjuensis]